MDLAPCVCFGFPDACALSAGEALKPGWIRVSRPTGGLRRWGGSGLGRLPTFPFPLDFLFKAEGQAGVGAIVCRE